MFISENISAWNTLNEYFYCINTSYPMDIANPVSADRPAKCQKKMSCVSTGQPVPSTNAFAR